MKIRLISLFIIFLINDLVAHEITIKYYYTYYFCCCMHSDYISLKIQINEDQKNYKDLKDLIFGVTNLHNELSYNRYLEIKFKNNVPYILEDETVIDIKNIKSINVT